MTSPAPLVDAEGLARFLSVGRETIDALRKAGRIPFVRIGPKTIRYEPPAVVEALRAPSAQREQRQGGAA